MHWTGPLTEAELVAMATNFVEACPGARANAVEYALAFHVAIRLLGRDWAERILGPVEVADRFIGSIQADGVERAVHQGRLWYLAETIVNLQPVRGFLPERLTALRNDRHGVEAASLELHAGRLLLEAGVPFSFKTGARRGENYELDFQVGGDSYPLEVKAKLEETVCSAETVRNSINTARKQLPERRKGVIVLGLPETWTALSLNAALVRQGVDACLRATSRIAAVVVTWPDSAWSRTGGTVLHKQFVVYNDRVSLPAEVRALLEGGFPIAPSVPWISLREIARAAASSGA